MYICEHWSCDGPAASDAPVCLSHDAQFEQGALDDCPSCDQLKEREFSFCGDCEPVASTGKLLEYDPDDYWGDEYNWLKGDSW